MPFWLEICVGGRSGRLGTYMFLYQYQAYKCLRLCNDGSRSSEDCAFERTHVALTRFSTHELPDIIISSANCSYQPHENVLGIDTTHQVLRQSKFVEMFTELQARSLWQIPGGTPTVTLLCRRVVHFFFRMTNASSSLPRSRG